MSRHCALPHPPSLSPRADRCIDRLAAVVALPLAALADWPQFQGRGTHDGVSDGPTAPFELTWRNDDIEIIRRRVVGGLSAPVVADDGTIVVVGPHEVLMFDGADGAETRSTERAFGPVAQPAIAEGPDGRIAVFTEVRGRPARYFRDAVPVLPAADTSDDEEDGFDSHVRAMNLATGEDVWASPVRGKCRGRSRRRSRRTRRPRPSATWTAPSRRSISRPARSAGRRTCSGAGRRGRGCRRHVRRDGGGKRTRQGVVTLDPSNGEERWPDR